MKVLVTGANGYIGRHLIKILCDAGMDVVALYRIFSDELQFSLNYCTSS